MVGEGSADLMSNEQFKAQFGGRLMPLEQKVLGLAGPFCNGEQDGFQIIRYETWAVYEALSN